MKHLFFAMLFAAMLVMPAQAQDNGKLEELSIEQLQHQAPNLHPAALYLLASRLLASGQPQEAANWMYAGQLRYRFLLEVEGASAGDELVLFSALSEQVGRPVNEYIAGDVDEWLAAIDWALQWDAANDNGTTAKTEHAEALTKVRGGLTELRASIDSHRAEIPEQRAANGLENR